MSNVETCSECKTVLPIAGVHCDLCYNFIGFPNIRRAIKEKPALDARYNLEMASVRFRKIENVANDFETALVDSNVVIVKSMIDLVTLIGSENNLISTFHQQIAGGARIAEHNYYDQKRDSVESLVHPLYYSNIHYAALSLDNVGVKYYGEAHIKLNSEYIKDRTSFFEGNAFNLIKQLGLAAGDDFPEGYRSTWENKGKLALCKYHSNLQKDTVNKADFQKVVLVETHESDFIEAHIYGSIHLRCIEKVTLLDSASEVSKMLFDAHKVQFINYNINTEVRAA